MGVIHELKGMLEQFNYRFLVTMDVEREGTIDGKGCEIVLNGRGFPLVWLRLCSSVLMCESSSSSPITPRMGLDPENKACAPAQDELHIAW